MVTHFYKKVISFFIFFSVIGFKSYSINYKPEIIIGVGCNNPLKGMPTFVTSKYANFQFASLDGKALEPITDKSKVGFLEGWGADFSFDFRFLTEVGAYQYFLLGFTVGYRLVSGGIATKAIENIEKLKPSPTSWMLHRTEIKLPFASNFWEGFWIIIAPKIAFNFAGSFKSRGADQKFKDYTLIDYGFEVEPSYNFYGVRFGLGYGMCFASIPKQNISTDFLGHKYKSSDKDRVGMLAELKFTLSIDPLELMRDE